MYIKDIIIEDKTKEKTLNKHGVLAHEIRNILLDSPLILRSKFNRYLAIGHYFRYLTVIFELSEQRANIITAYPSSEAQIKLYKKKNE